MNHGEHLKQNVIVRFLRTRLTLETDKADDAETIEYIRKNVEFKGPNLWILVLAVIIASVGLNVNSTAVIIGAMLISPLMGPIIGIGLGASINDLDLLKKSAKNLFIAALFSVAASALYFSLTPLTEEQSELLSRTNPTIWDVLIALFGGFAGIIANTRREKTNVIPGVAIATALMPPLCTAGYGLAHGNVYYFLGAFYLFFINGVCISLSTLIVTRILRYPKTEFIDQARERRARRLIGTLFIITIIPSIYLAYRTVQRSVFEQQARKFIKTEMQFAQARVISFQTTFRTDSSVIDVSVFGESLSQGSIDTLKYHLAHYGLTNTHLNVFQGYHPENNRSNLRDKLVHEIYQNNEEVLQLKNEKIRALEDEISESRKAAELSVVIAGELRVLYPAIRSFSLNRNVVVRMDSLQQDTVMLAVIGTAPMGSRDQQRIRAWLTERLKPSQTRVVFQALPSK